MTTENTNVDNANDVDNTATAGGDQPQAETLESLKAERDAMAAEAAKERSIRKKLQAERDSAKKAKPVEKDANEETYKELNSTLAQKLEALQGKLKSTAIKEALTAKLSTSKVQADKMEAALALVDKQLVEWDEDSGVDSQSVTGAVQKLLNTYGWLKETKVVANSLKPAAEGSATGKTLTRAEFERLSPEDKMQKMVKDKYTVVD